MYQIFTDAAASFEKSFRCSLDQSGADDDTFANALSIMFQAMDALDSIGASLSED